MKQVKIKFYRNKHFYINILAGLLILLISHLIENTQFGIKNLDVIFDFFILNESVKAQEGPRQEDTLFSKDIVFIDINYANFSDWKFPLNPPRDQLANIIYTAASAGAKIIVPDFLFEYNDYKNPKYDDALRTVLLNIPLNDSTKNTKIIFPVIIGINGQLKSNIFDSLINKYNANYYYAIPNLLASGHDGVIRYTEDYECYTSINKNKDTISSKLLSIPYIVSKLFSPEFTNNKNLYEEFQMETGRNICEDTDKWGKEINAGNYLYDKRIRFFIIPGTETDTIKRTGHIPIARKGNIPAKQYFRIDNLIPKYFEGKIIIIGSSNPESADNHITPIGMMPGMYILGNTINTEIKNLYPKEVSLLLKLSIEITIVIIASFLFLLFNEFAAEIMGSIIILILFGSINYYIFYNYGVFINIFLPVLGMGFHRIVRSFEIVITSGIRNRI